MAKKKKEKDSFMHCVTRRVLLCYRVFGIFPVEGLTLQRNDKLRFNPRSVNMFLFILSLILKLLETSGNLYQASSSTLTFRTIVETVLGAVNFVRMLLLLRLAYDWPTLINATSSIENVLPLEQLSVIKRNNIIFVSFTTLNFLQAILFVLYFLEQSIICSSDDRPIFEVFMKYTQPTVFRFTTFETWKGIIFLISLCQNLFVMNVFEILLMQISIYLTSFFEDFNRRVKENVKHSKVKTVAWTLERPILEPEETDWGVMRVEYMQILKLVSMVNDKLSALIFLTFGHNLMLLWGQLLMVFKRGQYVDISKCDIGEYRSVLTAYNYIRYFFLYFSLSVMIFRFFIASILAASIHSASKKPAMTIYEISLSKSNCIEMERLLSQIRTSTVALGGLGFFRVTKHMMLNMAGTIVTYELMVLQFAMNEKTSPISFNETYPQ